MISTYIVSFLIILGLLSAWICITHIARLHAARHPEFGSLREEGAGCGGLCRCDLGGTCPKDDLLKNLPQPHSDKRQ